MIALFRCILALLFIGTMFEIIIGLIGLAAYIIGYIIAAPIYILYGLCGIIISVFGSERGEE